jgi:hypothetical protein
MGFGGASGGMTGAVMTGAGGMGCAGGITTGGGAAVTGVCAVPHHGQKSTGWGNVRPQPVLMQESSCAMVPRISLLP